MKFGVLYALSTILIAFFASVSLAADPNLAVILWSDDFTGTSETGTISTVFHPRWTKDIDPTCSPDDIYRMDDASGIVYFNNGYTDGSEAGKLRYYAHLETPVDMNVVTNIVGSSYTYTWGYEHNVGIYVYWDMDNWIGIHIDPAQVSGKRIRCRGRAQGAEIFMETGDTYTNTWYTLEMVFTDSQIKFFIENNPTVPPYILYHATVELPSFTLPRPATFYGRATLIYGKGLGNAGPGSANATNPDLDNNYTANNSYTENKWIRGRNVVVYGVESVPPSQGCPDVILPMDFNEDCYVDFADFAIFAESWLTCNNPEDPNCEL